MTEEQYDDYNDRKVLISGPRTYTNKLFVYEVLEELDNETREMGLNLVVVHDGRGVGLIVEDWAMHTQTDSIAFDDIEDWREANEAMFKEDIETCLIFSGLNAIAARNCAIIAKRKGIYVKRVVESKVPLQRDRIYD